MVQTFFTADLHLGHQGSHETKTGIIYHAKRPFTSVAEMDATIIANWNDVVGKRDVVWVLGDFCLYRNAEEYLPRLNGRLNLIWGNHDPNKTRKHPRWLSSQPQAEINVDGQKIVLNHYRMMIWNRHHHGALHLYGHSHGDIPGDMQCCDVGVDCWDYRPVSLIQIKDRLAQSPPHLMVDHHRRVRDDATLATEPQDV